MTQSEIRFLEAVPKRLKDIAEQLEAISNLLNIIVKQKPYYDEKANEKEQKTKG